jgi:hypothetical protein
MQISDLIKLTQNKLIALDARRNFLFGQGDTSYLDVEQEILDTQSTLTKLQTLED